MCSGLTVVRSVLLVVMDAIESPDLGTSIANEKDLPTKLCIGLN